MHKNVWALCKCTTNRFISTLKSDIKTVCICDNVSWMTRGRNNQEHREEAKQVSCLSCWISRYEIFWKPLWVYALSHCVCSPLQDSLKWKICCRKIHHKISPISTAWNQLLCHVRTRVKNANRRLYSSQVNEKLKENQWKLTKRLLTVCVWFPVKGLLRSGNKHKHLANQKNQMFSHIQQ